MKKTQTGYTLQKTEGETVRVMKDGTFVASGAIGIESALEAIFVLEKMTKKDWLVEEDGVVYLVDREEYGKGINDESR